MLPVPHHNVAGLHFSARHGARLSFHRAARDAGLEILDAGVVGSAVNSRPSLQLSTE